MLIKKVINWETAVTGLLLGFAALLRINVYLQNHSVQLDEANLARNIIEKPYSAFFHSLSYQQYAPPFFLIVEKINTELWGTSEYALRLIPLFAGIGSLFVFYALAKKFSINGPVLWFILFILSFSSHHLHYAVEAKQYGSDVFIALIMLYLSISEDQNFDRRFFIKWSIIGIIAIWTSMPSVFILSGIGIYFAGLYLKSQRQGKACYILLTGLVWLCAFGLYYFSVLKADISESYLQSYHRDYFLKLPLSQQDIRQDVYLLLQLIRSTIGHTAIAIALGLISITTGVFALYKEGRTTILLLCIPMLSLWIAAALHQYSLIPRLTLFATPVLLLLSGIGLNFLISKMHSPLRYSLFILMIATASLHRSAKYLFQSYRISDLRAALDRVSLIWEAGDLMYISHETKAAYYYYTALHPGRNTYPFKQAIIGYWKEDDILQRIPSNHRLWTIHSHLLSRVSRQKHERALAILKKQYRIVAQWREPGVSYELLKKYVH